MLFYVIVLVVTGRYYNRFFYNLIVMVNYYYARQLDQSAYNVNSIITILESDQSS